MSGRIPESKLGRGLAGGRAAAKVGGEVLQYYATKPFRSPKSRERAQNKLDEKTAQAIFGCLSLLRGTALKVAQMLSLELELLPPALQRELQKSYNQVPPINRALARKAVTNALGRPPEEVFQSFEPTAFAAASLGQVHQAAGPGGRKLAVKLQYPGIQKTIKSDLQLLRGVLRPLHEYETAAPVINEIEQRLLEEIDYVQERDNMVYFKEHLDLEGVVIPRPWRPGSSNTILSATFIEGLPLNQWLKTNPGQEERDWVAQRLNDIFLYGLYELHRIHADPNPGNFIIADDLTVGLVDFGCVKKFQDRFVRLYSKLPGIIVQGDQNEYFEILRALEIIQPGLDRQIQDEIFEAMHGFGQWLAKMYTTEQYDFRADKDFMIEGKVRMQAMYKYRGHMSVNPQAIFLNRTRYGLMRIFQQMGARVKMRSPYEWDA